MSALPAVLVAVGAGMASMGSAFVIPNDGGPTARVVKVAPYVSVVLTGVLVVGLGLRLGLSAS